MNDCVAANKEMNWIKEKNETFITRNIERLMKRNTYCKNEVLFCFKLENQKRGVNSVAFTWCFCLN
ncbi:UNVERIFIED_CONTAM: hypothetical protein NCL1_52913 [Trichonephila clavipes]